MNIYEALVESLLTQNGLGMVCPQFTLPWEEGTSSVDFLAWDFVRNEVALVEVSAAENPAGLLEKAARFPDDRERLLKWAGDRLHIEIKQSRFIGFLWDPRRAYKKTMSAPYANLISFVGLRDIMNLGDHWTGRQRGFPVRDPEKSIAFPV